jgi:hypothetical protein
MPDDCILHQIVGIKIEIFPKREIFCSELRSVLQGDKVRSFLLVRACHPVVSQRATVAGPVNVLSRA